jgi:multidrug efflux pump subunit AcrA (membrane-fusion protein)
MRLADLRRVWILADLFQNEAAFLKPGQAALITFADGAPMHARVSETLPLFDPASRTMKVRLEADNPAYRLQPGMLVDVEFPVRLPVSINIPVDALVDSGVHKTVFVDRGGGRFEPRSVETGWRFGDRVEIVKGLTPGERIALSGAFLLDSETRMRQ